MERKSLFVVVIFCCIAQLFVRCGEPPHIGVFEAEWLEKNPEEQVSRYAVYGFRLAKPEIELVQSRFSRSIFLDYCHIIPRNIAEASSETKEEAKKNAQIICSDDADKLAVFDSIARSYGDVGYSHLCTMRLLYTQVYNVDKVTNISVFAIDDWSDRYPRGSCLDDNFIFISGSPDSYIRNGYRLDDTTVEKSIIGFEGYPWKEVLYDVLGSTYVSQPVCGKLSEIDFDQYTLLGFENSLGLLDPIELSSHQAPEIAVEISYKDGTKVRLTGYYKRKDQNLE